MAQPLPVLRILLLCATVAVNASWGQGATPAGPAPEMKKALPAPEVKKALPAPEVKKALPAPEVARQEDGAQTTPEVELESLPTSKIVVSHISQLPRNFNDVTSVAWSSDGKRLLVDRIRKRAYEIAEITVPEEFGVSDWLPERVLVSSEKGQLLHFGCPSWADKGNRFFVYVSQLPRSRDFAGGMPWNGTHCNLAVCDSLTKRSIPLTRNMYSLTRPRGSTYPAVSADGRQLSWSGLSLVRRPGKPSFWGVRSLYLGQLSWVRGVPTLTDIREIVDPRHGLFYENYGFTRDGKSLLYAASRVGQPWFVTDIFMRDVQGNTMRNLTANMSSWNRWAHLSPQGRKIVWSSSSRLANPNMGVGGTRWQQELRTDLWIMNADGSDKRRLTHFNTLDSRDNRLLGLTPYEHCYVGQSAWHPNGRKLAVVLNFGNRHNASSIVLLLQLNELGR